jgi:hypothetical protein
LGTGGTLGQPGMLSVHRALAPSVSGTPTQLAKIWSISFATSAPGRCKEHPNTTHKLTGSSSFTQSPNHIHILHHSFAPTEEQQLVMNP